MQGDAIRLSRTGRMRTPQEKRRIIQLLLMALYLSVSLRRDGC
jgi:hypothetical protein